MDRSVSEEITPLFTDPTRVCPTATNTCAPNAVKANKPFNVWVCKCPAIRHVIVWWAKVIVNDKWVIGGEGPQASTGGCLISRGAKSLVNQCLLLISVDLSAIKYLTQCFAFFIRLQMGTQWLCPCSYCIHKWWEMCFWSHNTYSYNIVILWLIGLWWVNQKNCEVVNSPQLVTGLRKV